jgi:2-C-methyl-D-erythritol 2,4-cyclodiphosphate synthase
MMNCRWRIGYGEDIHALKAGRALILGGVKIAYPCGLDAHSDGDVVYHALADALLGSVAAGDIGKWFPPSDQSITGIDSSKIVSFAFEKVQEKGYQIGNVDIAIACEKPHLASYLPLMQQNIASLLHVEPEAISLKAMTNEGFDAVGQGKAIRAVALVLVCPQEENEK